MICNLEHRYDSAFEVLPDSQRFSEGRHKCAGCAYEQGLAHGLEYIEPSFNIEILDESQAGVVRHKSPLAAYNMGYTDGLRRRANS